MPKNGVEKRTPDEMQRDVTALFERHHPFGDVAMIDSLARPQIS